MLEVYNIKILEVKDNQYGCFSFILTDFSILEITFCSNFKKGNALVVDVFQTGKNLQ
jgi:hypothetical protein